MPAQTHFGGKYKYGFKLGYTGHSITGGRVPSKIKFYFEGGIWLQLKLHKKWRMQTEILFVEKGTGGGSNTPPIYGDYWVGLYYFEFPVLFQYQHKHFFAEFGPGLGALVYGHEILHLDTAPDLTNRYPFSKKELSFNFGAGFSIGEKWRMGLRYTTSLLPVRQQLPNISKPVYNHLLAIQFSRSLILRKTKKLEDLEG